MPSIHPRVRRRPSPTPGSDAHAPGVSPPNLTSQGEFRPKQSLGQNYLSDQNYVMKICNHFGDSSEGGRRVLELGPGAGALTQVRIRYCCRWKLQPTEGAGGGVLTLDLGCGQLLDSGERRYVGTIASAAATCCEEGGAHVGIFRFRCCCGSQPLVSPVSNSE